MSRATPILVFFMLLAMASTARASHSYYWEWKQPPEPTKLQACVGAMRKILAARHLIGYEPAPVAANGRRVNAVVGTDLLTIVESATEDTEPFVFPGRKGINSCQTDGAAYDEVVTACLIVARDYFTPAELGIGGAPWPAAWTRGAACYKEVLAREPQNPLGGTSLEALGDTGGFDQVDPSDSQDSPWPWWTRQALWAGAGLAVLLVLLYFMKPRADRPGSTWHFQIHVRNGKVSFTGRIPVNMEWTLREFFQKDVPVNRSYKVLGRWTGTRLIIEVRGAKDREQQIRNYLKMVLGRLPAPVD